LTVGHAKLNLRLLLIEPNPSLGACLMAERGIKPA